MPHSATGRRDSTLEHATEQGRVCAVAIECLRDLCECAEDYPDLFSAKPLGPTVFSGVSMALAFGSPKARAAGIRMAARTTLWAFAADWLLDYAATTRTEIDAIVVGCGAVGDSAAPEPGASIQLFLADLRDELAGRPGWESQYPVWRERLQRYLLANAREWEWKFAHKAEGAAGLPSLDDYLANADNHAATFVNVSHWIDNEVADTADDLRRLAEASDEVQRALRLLNDLATYERDLAWGDLNSLMLGVTPEDIRGRLDALIDSCEELLVPLSADFPAEADYLRRQLGHSLGFYATADYWGTQ